VSIRNRSKVWRPIISLTHIRAPPFLATNVPARQSYHVPLGRRGPIRSSPVPDSYWNVYHTGQACFRCLWTRCPNCSHNYCLILAISTHICASYHCQLCRSSKLQFGRWLHERHEKIKLALLKTLQNLFCNLHDARKRTKKLHKRRTNTDLWQHFFTERNIINIWNMLDEDAVSANTVNSFKRHLQRMYTDGSFTRLSKSAWPLGPSQIPGKARTGKILVRYDAGTQWPSVYSHTFFMINVNVWNYFACERIQRDNLDNLNTTWLQIDVHATDS